MSLVWPPKDPDEVLDFDVDWTKGLYSKAELAAYQALIDAGSTEAAALAAVPPADSISSSTFTIPAGGTLVANSSSNTSTSTKVWLAAGLEIDPPYLIVNEIHTGGGRIMDRTIKLKIKLK